MSAPGANYQRQEVLSRGGFSTPSGELVVCLAPCILYLWAWQMIEEVSHDTL